jgi:hypothetical protein
MAILEYHNHKKLLAEESLALEHFLSLARRGRSGTASGGEQRAYRLAIAILADAAGMDQSAIEGMAWFARLSSANHAMAEACVGITS